MQSASARLIALIDKWTAADSQFVTAIPGLKLTRFTATTPSISYTHQPSLCLIAQGRKGVLLGDKHYLYDASQFLLSSMELPVIANIAEASVERPYLSLALELDLKALSELIIEGEFPLANVRQPQTAISVGVLTPELLDAIVRLLSLQDEPQSIRMLAPLITREIYYRLLSTEQGGRLQQLVAAGSHSHQISKAISWLKSNFTASLSIDELASDAGMSKSAFYTHFRAITSMTPLQFQKKLRLGEARRLMLTENLDAMSTSFQVGYESPSQFSREYSRLFGAPPLTDIRKLKESDAA
ncbi:AraC family transcriptional regulator [Shewanella mangrovi]|uniref:AraC family transcriptional regulator n=2 Tax=Shewanella mangrovi TaxID=1515746 RepID=A0A094JHY8_9GAMM|nr:AraC family transcriptional regulator [Shewanella mangrovi]